MMRVIDLKNILSSVRSFTVIFANRIGEIDFAENALDGTKTSPLDWSRYAVLNLATRGQYKTKNELIFPLPATTVIKIIFNYTL